MICDVGIIAVIRAENLEKSLKIVDACINGGINAIEITYTIPKADQVICELVNIYKGNTNIIIGAGTVLDTETARSAILNGAQFIVSPCFDKEVAKLCNRYQIPYIPGVQTVSEVKLSLDYGCDLLKIFPGDIFGPRFIKDVKGPLPQANMMPSGGVDIINIPNWIRAGAVCISVGSSLIASAKKDDYLKISELAKEFIQTVKQARLENNIF